MSAQMTTIKVRGEIKNRLEKYKTKSERTYDEVLEKILNYLDKKRLKKQEGKDEL